MKKSFYLFLSSMLLIVGQAKAWDGSGTEADPYLIRNSADWATLATETNAGNTPAGTFFKLTGDISASACVGTSGHPFMGSFDGGGHTVNATLTASTGVMAPFAYVKNASIGHVKVAGNITGGKHTAGLVGVADGGVNYIEDCHVTATILTNKDGDYVIGGGILGHGKSSNTTISGCLFEGRIETDQPVDESYAGAIVGWCDSASGISVINCIENAGMGEAYSGWIQHVGMTYTSGSATAITAQNSYTLTHNWGEVKHGYKVVNLSDELEVVYSTSGTGYPTTGIQPCASGLLLNGTYYGGSGDEVYFQGTFDHSKYNGILNCEESGANYKLTMPAADVFLSLTHAWKGSGTASEPYLIESGGDWQQLAVEVTGGNTHSGHYFLLTNDIDIYMPIGGSDQEHAFAGKFDGGGHTVTANLVGGDYTAPFSRIHNAEISHLHVAGTIKGGLHVAGLVGGTFVTSINTITDCRVSASITTTSTHAGGFIGHASNSTTTLKGCLMDGNIYGTVNLQYAGLFFGWSGSATNLSLQDCLSTGTSTGVNNNLSWQFNNENIGAACGTVSNTYHNGNMSLGKHYYTVTTNSPMLLFDCGTAKDDYPTTGLQTFASSSGLRLDNILVAGSGETVGFHLTALEGFGVDSDVTASSGTLNGDSSDGYTLTLASKDVVVSATVISPDYNFKGTGTDDDPFLIETTRDWMKLSVNVAFGSYDNVQGKVFRLTKDIDTEGVMVGSESNAFRATFDGDGHTLTFNVGTKKNPVADEWQAPFQVVSGATIRHLSTTGIIYTKAKHAAGIVARVSSTAATHLMDCHSNMSIYSFVSGEGVHGGLVAEVSSNVDSLEIEKCSFTGNLLTSTATTKCGGFVGSASAPVTIHNSVFDPQGWTYYDVVKDGATFARMNGSNSLTLDKCYATYQMNTPQGMFIVSEIDVPSGVTYEFQGEPDVTIDGKHYYTNGCQVKFIAPDGLTFNHWEDNNGCFIYDPWRKDGIHQLKDMSSKPMISISTNSIPEAETERTLWGVTYRYLSRRDYHYYISDEERVARGWEFESDDSDANLIVKDSNGKASEITAITGYKESDYNDDGVQIHNDLVGDWRNHTHLALIAPRAFKNSSALKTLYFKDTDANNYNALLPFEFYICDGAFENCSNFNELKMMQYTTEGSNHWEALTPDQVISVADDAFNGCGQLKISVLDTLYQNYVSSSVWYALRNRFIIYEATTEDFKIENVSYHYYRDAQQIDALKSDESGKSQMMDHIRNWNAAYKNFSAASLLDTNDRQNIYYTSITDLAEDVGLGHHVVDTMNIYNDANLFFNSKTICLDRNAIAGNTNLKYIRFKQTNKKAYVPSYDLKMVIPNEALKGCTSLLEISMYYYVNEVPYHWEPLGPENVIPGNNIFGLEAGEDLATSNKVPKNLKIIVSPDRYQDFLYDANWKPYLDFVVPADFDPTNQFESFEKGNLVYNYMTSPGGIIPASQVVSQDVSWWTAPRIAAEVGLLLLGIAGVEQVAQIITSPMLLVGNDVWYGLSDEVLSQIAWAVQAQEIGNTIFGEMVDYNLISFDKYETPLNYSSAMTTNAACISKACWGDDDAYNNELLNKGMRQNILSNIHQVGVVGGGYIITTPQKNLVYHTYIKSVKPEATEATIYAGKKIDSDHSTRTMTFAKDAFRGNIYIQKVGFHDNDENTSNASMPMLITIPDSAFVGCTSLREFNLLMETDGNGTRALGPENFIMAGDSVFAGLDPEKFHIVIDEARKKDFLDNASWKPLEKYFTYQNAKPESKYNEYGAEYAYAYELNSIKRQHKESGHLIEHTMVIGSDDDFLKGHQGALKLCNDIGVYNNYQLDEVMREAFMDNKFLRTVSFTDLKGLGAFSDSYTNLKCHIGDRAFEGCSNLVNLDLLYMVTDGTNHIDLITPQMLTIGKDVFKNSPARLKMMPQQVAWFEADSSWVRYKDRFMPCIISLSDPGVKKALKDMAYYDPANTGTDQATWDDYCDFARIGGAGFSWLDGKFTAQKDNIYSFADFRWFESVGLNYVGASWFEGCSKLGNIVLPATITDIRSKAFNGCSTLKEIELPKNVATIGANAFGGCTSLNTIVVKGETPATLGSGAFHKHDGLKIYVPAAKVNDYKSAWSEYAAYIVSDNDYKINKVVTVTAVGQLASKLGLTLIKENSKTRYIQGPYAKYDSLTVIGPLNGEDLGVIRHMMGANAWESEYTDGQLHYLNLWDADLKKDTENSYNGRGVDEYLEKDNWVGEYVFDRCNAIETVILPKSVTEIGENTFQDAKNLKRIAVGKSTTKYTRDLLQDLNGIEELVFLTNSFASSESSDPWEALIQQCFTLKSQLGSYISDPGLTRRAQNVSALFNDDAVVWALADKGHFFPTEYLRLDDVDDLFAANTAIKTFDDFCLFNGVKTLNTTFSDMSNMETVTLPISIDCIGAEAFKGCSSLNTISVYCDSVPQLAHDAFEDLPDDFKILVPLKSCKLYREKWAQYADHINPVIKSYNDDELITVTVTEPNTLAAALGLTMTTDKHTLGSQGQDIYFVNGLKGDYSRIRRLKVNGPISCADLSVLRHLAGYTPWSDCRNYMGPLYYLDLYDAELKYTPFECAPDEYYNLYSGAGGDAGLMDKDVNDQLPSYAFLKAYNLRTLILPKTCKTVKHRAIQECEGLEVLVIGDDCEEFNWNALDDDAMLTRLYILTKQKLNISTEDWIWRNLCNNYNPTFDAFYVPPTLYNDYLYDNNYTGSSWQRTNNISKGAFTDDASFRYFAAHAAATRDDVRTINSVDGWSKNHEDVVDLTLLGYSAVNQLCTEDMQQLTKLEKVALPSTLLTVGTGAFTYSQNLRYVDMLNSNGLLVSDIKKRGLADLGIDSLQTLVYMPPTYGTSDGTNIVVGNGLSMAAKTFRLVDGRDYCVPYPFEAGSVENSRVLRGKDKPYVASLPYQLTLDPTVAKVYKPTDREGTMVTFVQVADGKMEAFKPYVVRPVSRQASLDAKEKCTIPASAEALIAPDNQWNVPGYAMRGTLSRIDNSTAHDLGAKMLADSEWIDVPANNENAYIAPFRAYILESGTGGAQTLTMQFVDDETTGIDTIHTIDLDGTERYYDLNGRQLEGRPEKGIYIYNGKKYVKK
jgi:hypothetical protein